MKAKKIIYNALCFDGNSSNSPNLVLKNTDLYLKSSFVSLKSALDNNPDCDVALITNQKLPEKFEKIYVENNIKIIINPFTKYVVPDNFKWKLAFYKLEALDYIVNETEYEFILGTDADTFFNDNLDLLWIECKYNHPILYPLGYNLFNPVRKQIIIDYQNINGCDDAIIQYGGEFIAGNKNALSSLSSEIQKVYSFTVKQETVLLDKTSGDEALLSMAAYRIEHVLFALPYIKRYWTRKAYYDADSSFIHMPIWHLPAEKNYGLINVYNYYDKHKHLPPKKKIYKYFNLPRQAKYNLNMIKYYLFCIKNRRKRK